MIDVKLIMYTKGHDSDLATFELTYPLFIHAQMMTHRVFSRNTASMRAIPVSKVCNDVMENQVFPETFQINQPGMVGGVDMSQSDSAKALALIEDLKKHSCDTAMQLAEMGVHKQWANRLVSPYAHTKVILTGTEFEEFFNLRCSDAGDPQPEISELADKMKLEMSQTPRVARPVHIPYCDFRPAKLLKCDEFQLMSEIIKSVAKSARVSYNRVHAKTSLLEDCELFLKLINPKFHASPFEHCAFLHDSRFVNVLNKLSKTPTRKGNLGSDFIQLRHSGAIGKISRFAESIVAANITKN